MGEEEPRLWDQGQQMGREGGGRLRLERLRGETQLETCGRWGRERVIDSQVFVFCACCGVGLEVFITCALSKVPMEGW